MKSCMSQAPAKNTTRFSHHFLFVANKHSNNKFNFERNKTIKKKRNENKMIAKDAKCRVYSKFKKKKVCVFRVNSSFIGHRTPFSSFAHFRIQLRCDYRAFNKALFCSCISSRILSMYSELPVKSSSNPPKWCGTCPFIFSKIFKIRFESIQWLFNLHWSVK